MNQTDMYRILTERYEGIFAIVVPIRPSWTQTELTLDAVRRSTQEARGRLKRAGGLAGGHWL